MKLTFFLLITLLIATNCDARPGGFTESITNTWHGVKNGIKSIFGKSKSSTSTTTSTESQTTEIIPTTTESFSTTLPSDCYEIVDGICLTDVTASPQELEDFERSLDGINVRFLLTQDEPCPNGFKRGQKGNCRKIAR